MEDVGRHNAVDKIPGWMFKEKVKPGDKIFYTTGRLTSEMVIKTVRMGIPISFHARASRLGRRARAQGQSHADRPRTGKTLSRARRRGSYRVRPGSGCGRRRSSKHRRKAAVQTNDNDVPVPATLGLLLAGRLARRIGRRQASIEIGGETILDRALATLSAHCTDIIINANGDPSASPTRPRGGARQRARPSRPARRILAGLDWPAAQDNGVD